MISHEHKCIFIHISKCAGSSIESAFGIDISNNFASNNVNLFGWHEKSKTFLQHCTPQELLDFAIIDRETWDTYYKFIIVRNPWDRALSDYIWLSGEMNVYDTFENFIKRKGAYEKYFDEKNIYIYRGDHLTAQIDYFFLDGKIIEYDKILRFEQLNESLFKVTKDLNLPKSFFKQKLNIGEKKFNHYSKFYNRRRKELIGTVYKDDVNFLRYKFEDFRNIYDYLKFRKASFKLIE